MFLPVVALGTQLAAAEIRVHVAADSARVEARYRFDAGAAADSARFVLIRLTDQAIRWLGPIDAAPAVALEPGLQRLTAGPDAVVTLRFDVVGPLARIPIPVPEAATPPGSDSVTLLVSGLPPAAQLDESFPKLRIADGVAVARLANVPSILRLPPSDRGWSLNDAVQAAGILLALAAVAWVSRVRRVRAGSPAG